jgi:hypothetical protein
MEQKNFKTVTYHSIPVYVSDEHTKYFLFDIYLPETYDEESILLVTRIIEQLRHDFILDKKNIDRTISSFLNTLPFYSFNFLHFQVNQSTSRYTEEGLTTFYIGEKFFPLSTVEKDDLLICLTLAAVYVQK